MNFINMKIDELKAFLDEHEVNYSDAKVKADYVLLAEQVKAAEVEVAAEVPEQEEQPTNLADKVKSAIKIERTETKKVDETAYLADRDYGQLSVGERAMIRNQSPEYENQSGGVEAKVTDRLPTKHRIVKLASKSYVKILKGVTYKLSTADFEVLKDEQVKVKTEATKNKCCGQAKYELVNLLEVANG